MALLLRGKYTAARRPGAPFLSFLEVPGVDNFSISSLPVLLVSVSNTVTEEINKELPADREFEHANP